jgi:cobalt-precorrin-7 (C5)-methyltransferase
VINVVGIGPGDRGYLTPLALELIMQSDWLVGGERQLAAFDDFVGNKRRLDSRLTDLVGWLTANQHLTVTVLASGDPMLYGIGKYLSGALDDKNIRLVSGISSIQYLFSRIGLDMNDLYLTSSHGKTPDFDFILQHNKVALVTDTVIGPRQIAEQIIQRGLRRTLIIGENLSYADERIHILAPAQVADGYDLNVVVILNEGQ